MIIEGLPFIALRRYRPLIFDRYGQWSVTIEHNGQTLQFSDVMGTVSFCIHFFEPYRLAAIKGGCVRSLLLSHETKRLREVKPIIQAMSSVIRYKCPGCDNTYKDTAGTHRL